MIGRAVFWSDIQLLSTLTQAGDVFPRVGLEAAHKSFQPLSVCFITGTFWTVHTPLKCD